MAEAREPAGGRSIQRISPVTTVREPKPPRQEIFTA
jgi:hypothetical protein